MWPQTIKSTFLIVTCNITIIGTKESAVAQYLCCNPNWRSLECFGNKTRRRPEPCAARLGGSELLVLGTSSSGEVPWVPLLRRGLGGPSWRQRERRRGDCSEPGCRERWLVACVGDALGQAARTAALLSWGAVVRDCSFFEAFWLGWVLFWFLFTPDT